MKSTAALLWTTRHVALGQGDGLDPTAADVLMRTSSGEAQAFPAIRLFTGIGTMADTVAGAFTDSRSIILVFNTSRLGGPA